MTDAYPETLITATADLELPDRDPLTVPGTEIVYCEVSWKQITDIKKEGWASKQIVVLYNDQRRFARVILPRGTAS